jgi:hypothetical protein
MSDNNAITTVAQATQMLEIIEQKKRAFIPLLRELVVNGKKLSDQQIIGRAVYAATEGLDPITEVHTLVDSQGNTMCHMTAINGLRRKNQEQVGPGNEITMSFAEMSPDEMAKCKGAVIGYKCYLRDGQSYGHWQKRLLEVGKCLREAMGQPVTFEQIIAMVGPAPVTEGIGLFYSSEYNDFKDKNFNPAERAKKRAELNARHHKFSTHSPVYEGDNGAIVLETSYRDALPTPTAQPALEATVTAPVRRTVEQNMTDLGYSKDATEIAEARLDPPQPEPEAQPQFNLDVQPSLPEWPAELLDYLVTANLGVKDTDKLHAMLDRSQFVKPNTEKKWLAMYVSYYCQMRKGGKDEATSATDADDRVANLMSQSG